MDSLNQQDNVCSIGQSRAAMAAEKTRNEYRVRALPQKACLTAEDKLAAIAAAKAGAYWFQVDEFACGRDFLRLMRRLEGMCRTRNYDFTPHCDEAAEVLFHAFVVVVARREFDGPFICETFNKRTRVRG